MGSVKDLVQMARNHTVLDPQILSVSNGIPPYFDRSGQSARGQRKSSPLLKMKILSKRSLSILDCGR